MRRSSSAAATIRPAPDLHGKHVLLLNHYLHPDTVRQAYPGALLESVTGTAAGLQRLADGKADAFIGDKTRANFHMLQRPDLKLQNKFAANLSSQGFAFAALASRQELIALIDHVLETTPASRKQEFLQRWTPARQLFAPTDAFALSPGEREWLKQKRVLSLIVEPTPPISSGIAEGNGAGSAWTSSAHSPIPTSYRWRFSTAKPLRKTNGACKTAKHCSPTAFSPLRSIAGNWHSACRSGSRAGPSSSASTPARPVRWKP